MAIEHVSDEVRTQLDPSAVRLPRRTRLRIAGWAAAGLVLIGLVLLATASGRVWPRVSLASATALGGQGTCSVVLTIANDGWFDEHVTAQTLRAADTAGRLSQPLSRTIPSGGSASTTVTFGAAWCRSHFPALARTGHAAGVELVLRLSRPWGTATTTIEVREPPRRDGFSVRW